MSLKAKIEAVIYAAEEPVTLAQLVGLLGGEAELELRRRESAQTELPLAGGSDAEAGGVPVGAAALPAEAEEAEIDAGMEGDPEALNAEVLGAEVLGAEVLGAETVGAAGEETGDVAGGGETAGAEGDFRESNTGTAAEGRAGSREDRERVRRVRELLRSLLQELMREYAVGDRGLEIREVAGGFRMATKPEYHDAVRGFARTLKPPLRLTLQALETLAVVAYKQPVTAPEISEIRGVDSGGVLGSLMARKLVTTAGRKQVIGRPILYKTTKDFLLRFGLKDVGELPSISEFEKLAGELAQEEIPMGTGMPFDGVGGYAAESPGMTRPGEDVVGAGDGGGSVDAPPFEGVSVPQADGDSVELPSTEDAEPVDGRIAGLDPADLEPGGNMGTDSPALDAAVRRDEEAGV